MSVNSNHLLLVVLLIAAVAAAKTIPMSKPNCPSKCGNVTIPFPFGLTNPCSLNTSFLITCNHSIPFLNSNVTTPFFRSNVTTPFFNTIRKVKVLDISLDGQLHVSLPVATSCVNNKNGESDKDYFFFRLYTPFHLSSRQNKLTVLGAYTAGVVYDDSLRFWTAYAPTYCVSFYSSIYDLSIYSTHDESCSGTFCCETPIQHRLSDFYYSCGANIFDYNSTDEAFQSYPCAYTFLVKEGAYNFSMTDFINFNTSNSFPVVVDWAVGNTCLDAQKNASSYACKSNYSECHNATEGPGYHCKCFTGFRGNPYLSDGCQDVDECVEESHDCVKERSTCSNSPGSYSCSCLKGYEGDGKNNGSGCVIRSNRKIIIALSVTGSILAFVGGTLYVYCALKKSKLNRLKEHFFQLNGGLLLQQQLNRYSGSNELTKIFNVKELKEATNNFNEEMVLGEGGEGTVYKGILPDNRIVAIKKSRISNPNQIEHFINEVILLCQINHRNVVKLLGCCLETEVPLLVYEFVPNGTVYEHLHDQSKSLRLTWKRRLQIAIETAGALAYLHSATHAPIVHRDVKTSNILLDHNLTTKVSDFGASKIIPLDRTQLTTLVLGTLGYLDPEYFHSSQLTEKSDVYSFGVVLAELLTGEKALSFERPEPHRNLAIHFHSSMNEGQLLDIVDGRIINEANVEQLMDVANIASHCLRLKGEERPTMKEVAMELEGINIVEKRQWEKVNLSSEETETLLKATPSSSFSVDGVNRRSMHSGSDILNRLSSSLTSGR
ncbi:wall-associated receptor kinase 2-like [Vigna umbellata]|uniref:wall-associated receptor kinase 2-like n=1 Tax=Vigna umbellata TaxID=87088 RepID=UPI001F5EC0C6|nr:wall-associated receptor kinase 2-like [Vigna umbellata]